LAGITISGPHPTGITLNKPTTQNPVTVAANGTVNAATGNGISGLAGFAWTVTNLGTVEGRAAKGSAIGVYLSSGGRLTNGSASSTKALIEGRTQGVEILGKAGTVVNFANIENIGTAGAGVQLAQGGTVTNGRSGATTGQIIGNAYGVAIGGAGTVFNFGFVRAIGAVTFPADSAGIVLKAGGSVNNLGTIEDVGKYGDAIELKTGGTIVNGKTHSSLGRIIGGRAGILVDSARAAATIVNVGTIQATGTHGIAVNILGRGTITNLGTIRGTGTDGRGVFLEGTDDVLINGNSATTTALIVGTHVGVNLGGSGVLTNFGTIESIGVSNTFNYAVNRPGHALTNFGKIFATGKDSFGIYVGHGENITNHGQIFAYRGGAVANSGAGPGAITNLGTIRSTQTAAPLGVIGYGVALQAGGSVVNGSTAVHTALVTAVKGDGVAIGHRDISGTASGSGTVTNFGTIRAVSGEGVYLEAGGRLTNSGVVAGSTYGVYLGTAKGTTTTAGTVVNTGTIMGRYGLVVAIEDKAGNALTSSGRIIGTGGTAVDFGAGNDVLTVNAGAVFSGKVEGEGGADKIVQGAGGTLNVAGFSGFETIVLFSGSADKLTLANANFAGVTAGAITITDGAKGNTVSAAGVAAADHIVVHAGVGTDVLTGGLGNDVFFAGGNTGMTGGAGINEFVFQKTGTNNTIKDFHVSAKNELVFSNAGFKLGLSGASATPKMLTAAQANTLFVANATGKFTKTSQRLAYDTVHGRLFASATGSAGTEHLVATLSDHATIKTSQLFFIS
jgi:hypothetical protein